MSFAPLAKPVEAWALVSPQGQIIIASISERLGQLAAYCERHMPQRLRALLNGWTPTRVRVTDTRKTPDDDQTGGALKPLIALPGYGRGGRHA